MYTFNVTGSRYQGTWTKGICEGAGELIHANHRYSGQFADNCMKGKGKYLFDIGCEQLGEYNVQEDQIQGETEEDEPTTVLKALWKPTSLCGIEGQAL